jgi:hypothetical protein
MGKRLCNLRLLSIILLGWGVFFSFYWIDSSKHRVPILAFSMDYKGCLAPDVYQSQMIVVFTACDSSQRNVSFANVCQSAFLLHHNIKLMRFLTQTIYAFKKSTHAENLPIIFFNGSNRQFIYPTQNKIDSLEYFKDAPLPVALTAIEALAHYCAGLLAENKLSIVIDPLLLSDIYEKKALGSTWEQVKRSPDIVNQIGVATMDKRKMDRDKFDIVYAQMQKLASQYNLEKQRGKGHILQYYFFDNEPGILENLQRLFKQHPDLLPKYSILHLIHYNSTQLTSIASIEGVGPTDYQYAKSIEYTCEQFKHKVMNGRLYKTRLLSIPEHVTAFKAYRLRQLKKPTPILENAYLFRLLENRVSSYLTDLYI